MKRVTLFAACSLDGFIARPDGSLDWLYAIPNPDNIDHGYGDLLASTSCIIMGRKTYADLVGFGIEWPYPDIKTFVVSSDPCFITETPNTEGWANFLACLKAYLEYGINLRWSGHNCFSPDNRSQSV
jgi:dihydrofolate reductase